MSTDDTHAESSRCSVLVVEDSEDMREALMLLLEELGHTVALAGNGLEGVEKILALRPDLTLVDVGLPGIDGHEVARRVRAAPGGEGLVLIALTGFGGSEARTAAIQAGFNRHMVKPIGVKDLVDLLASVTHTRK